MNPSKRKIECYSCHQDNDEEKMICEGCSEELRHQEYEGGFQDGKKEGYKEGWDEGFAKGHIDGIKKCIERIEREIYTLEKEIK